MNKNPQLSLLMFTSGNFYFIYHKTIKIFHQDYVYLFIKTGLLNDNMNPVQHFNSLIQGSQAFYT